MATSGQLDKLNKKISDSFNDFKSYVINYIVNGEGDLQSIYDFELSKQNIFDMIRKKRVKNNIPICERCEAKKASGERCSRRKKDETSYCGTHNKGTPHGKINDKQLSVEKIEIKNIEYKGIIYFVDNNGNVYNHDDILHNQDNPRVLCKYTKDADDKIVIVI
jgi:hypothetical protein